MLLNLKIILKNEVANSFQASANGYQSTLCHTPKYLLH